MTNHAMGPLAGHEASGSIRILPPVRVLQALPGQLRSRILVYSATAMRSDLMAGLTVAMVAVPQAMAYAAIAGVNPMYGLYTAIIPAIIAALFGSSPYLVSGPTNGTALVTAAVLLPLAGKPEFVEYVFAIAIASGLIRLLLGLFKLGFLVRFVSNAVLTGFLAGASLLIIVNQLGNLLGIRTPAGLDAPSLTLALARALPGANLYALATGLLAVAVVVGCRRYNPRLPGALLAIALATAMVKVTGWQTMGVRVVGDLGEVAAAGMSFHIPQISLGEPSWMLSAAGAVALYSLVEAMSVAKSFSVATGKPVNSSREFVGQGLASLAGGFFRCIPSSGSLSRSAVNYRSGATTRLSGVAGGVFVLIAMLILSGTIGSVPLSGLAGVVIVYAGGMINPRQLRLTWQSRPSSRAVMATTFVASIFLPLQVAIYLGVLLSIGIYLYESSAMRLTCLCGENGKFTECEVEEIVAHPTPVVVLNVTGALYFGAVDDFEHSAGQLVAAGVDVLILRIRNVQLLASSGVTALVGLLLRANRAGVHTLFCGVTPAQRQILDSSGITNLVGPDAIFPAHPTLLQSVSEAVERGNQLLHANRAATPPA